MSLDDFALRRLVNALAPLAEIDAVAGLRARSRDPREHPATGGEQRDAAAAVDAASDRGLLTAHRDAYQRFCQLPADVQATASWVAERGGAVREGADVGVAAWVEVYAREAPVALREVVERARQRASVASVALLAAKREARRGVSRELATKIDAATRERAEAREGAKLAQERLLAWALGRFQVLAHAWGATTDGSH